MICLECLNSGMTTKTYFSIPLEIYEPLTTEVTSVRVLVIKYQRKKGNPLLPHCRIKVGKLQNQITLGELQAGLLDQLQELLLLHQSLRLLRLYR